MTTTEEQLGRLAARLTEPHDRESYASLISFVNSLPPSDEFRKLAELMGLLSLLGQRLPDALAESMAQMRDLTTKAGEYYGQIDERLANLPKEITEGVDIAAIGEAFRQQLAATGLEASAAHLRNTCTEITALTARLKPVTEEYKALADSIAAGVSKLTAASAELQSQPVTRDRPRAWLGNGLFALVMFILGGLCVMLFGKIGGQ